MENKIREIRESFLKLNWEDQYIYANWLSQAYYITKKSTKFLCAAILATDLYKEFQNRCYDHIIEERGHEELILKDLKKLGFEKPLPELPETSAIYKTQYYSIFEDNPLSFLGYIFFLELLATEIGPDVIKKVEKDSAYSFLKVHANEDISHINEATLLLEKIKDENIVKSIFHNFDTTLSSYCLMMNKISLKKKIVV